MDLYHEIIVKILEKEEIQITFPDIKIDINKITADLCYNALTNIKCIIENDSLSDFDCVEKIVNVFEHIGSDGGNRHDF